MAVVWAGLDTRLDRPVAIKMLDRAGQPDPVLIRRLEREAQAVAGLAHPNIVGLYDVGTDDGTPYLVMELVPGETLQGRIDRGPLDVPAAVAITDQICAALEAAHHAGVVHRDVKPDNVLLTTTGVVKVCDFGIAALHEPAQVRLTSPGTVIGSSQYLAPELATGGAVDARSDLYAVGCVLYAMLAGAPPFSGDIPVRVVWQHVHEAPPPIALHRRDIPADLQALVARLLAKNPVDRPQTAGEVRARLARLPDLPQVRDSLTTTANLDAAASAVGRHARATAAIGTRIMPALEDITGDVSPGKGNGVRFGPLGIAAVAVGSAVLTAVTLVLLLQGPGPAAAPPLGVAGTSSVTTTRPSATAELTAQPTASNTDDLRIIIQDQVQAGGIDADAANQLNGTLDEIDHDLNRGRTNQAAQRLNDLANTADQMHNDGKMTDTAYSAIVTAIQQLASGLPATNQNN
jgi:serine/threonine-protein kinase